MIDSIDRITYIVIGAIYDALDALYSMLVKVKRWFEYIFSGEASADYIYKRCPYLFSLLKMADLDQLHVVPIDGIYKTSLSEVFYINRKDCNVRFSLYGECVWLSENSMLKTCKMIERAYKKGRFVVIPEDTYRGRLGYVILNVPNDKTWEIVKEKILKMFEGSMR